MMRSEKPEDRALVEKVRHRLAQPGGPRHPHQHFRRRSAAECAESRRRGVKFLEYLASDCGADIICQRQQRVADREGREA